MDLSTVCSRALSGLDAPLVRVETHLSNGLPAFHIVGMPETAVRESKDRVRSAILNSHFSFPDRRITVSLAPADLPKEGGRFDLPIALGILSASGQVPGQALEHHEFIGELGLDGSLRPGPGTLTAAMATARTRRKLVLPAGNASFAARVVSCSVIPATDLLTLCAHLNGNRPISPARYSDPPVPPGHPDLSDIVAQHAARRALEIAASGGHNLLFYGPPGTGKTLLASRLPGILPPADPDEALVARALHDLCGKHDQGGSFQRPFRSPHHTTSAVALAGGGSRPLPGEISLAHGGVLFLDELPEFSRHCLEVLRQPMESGEITISRARYKVTYPAKFQLIAAMNPCPCGFLGDQQRDCRCTPEQINRYRTRVSGPLLDRIDMHVPVYRVDPRVLIRPPAPGEPSQMVRQRVAASRQLQLARQGLTNARLPTDALVCTCLLGDPEEGQLAAAAEKMNLSGRAIHRTLRVARTIADMDKSPTVAGSHLSEALAYRDVDTST
jgi:magnesium chelatase family protein